MGHPVLRFNYRWSEQEINQARHMQDTMEELLEAAGGVLLGGKPGPETQLRPDPAGRNHP